jgi:hypothetical protein
MICPLQKATVNCFNGDLAQPSKGGVGFKKLTLSPVDNHQLQ